MIASSLLRNHVKERLTAGGTVLGTWIMMSRSPAVVRLAASAGFDFVFIDTEHSDFSTETVGDLCEVARACGIVPIVRPFDTSAHYANRLQDLGAMGLMYHDVTSREAVEEMRRAMTYPPSGIRGSSSLAATMDYQTGDGIAILGALDDDAMLVAQIESRSGVEQIEDIVASGEVDLIEVGRGDLAVSFGLPMQPRHALVMAALDEVIAACDRAGVPVGVNCTSVEDGRDLIARGVRSLAFSNDRRILLDGYQEASRELAGSQQPRVQKGNTR